jgi:hypothetical protein
MTNDLEKHRQEFFENVWNHSEDDFQITFDERRPLNEEEILLLNQLKRSFKDGKTDAEVSALIGSALKANPKLIEILLQISGMTRNKILQDIKASSRASRRALKLSSHLRLASHEQTWNHAGPYLSRKLRKVLSPPSNPTIENESFESLNQATWPGYIRQERAKRSGHAAEYAIAILLSQCGIPFSPKEKADNPLCRDAMWNDVSFDIMIPNDSTPDICIKSTVHTANIGQYGESKDHLEIDEAKKMIASLPEDSKRPLLVGFIDGVGFESNPSGLNGVISGSDEFCQFNTLWKLVIMAAFRLKTPCKIHLPDDVKEKQRDFLSRYACDLISYTETPIPDGIQAGCAIVKTG